MSGLKQCFCVREDGDCSKCESGEQYDHGNVGGWSCKDNYAPRKPDSSGSTGLLGCVLVKLFDGAILGEECPKWPDDKQREAVNGGLQDPLERAVCRPDRKCRECGAPFEMNHHEDCWTGRLEKALG